MKGYSFDFRKYNEDALCRAKIESIDMSFKDACAVCDAIRNKSVKEAMLLLSRVINMETPIPYRRHNKKMGHRKELGGKKGRWPVKEAKITLKLVKSLVANGIEKGLNEESLVIVHASANKKRTYPKLQPTGRRVRHDYELARIELVALDTSYDEERAKKIREEKEKERKIKEEAKKVKEEVKKEVKEKVEEKMEKSEKKEEKKEKVKEEKSEKKEKKKVNKERKEQKEEKKKGEKAKEKGESKGKENKKEEKHAHKKVKKSNKDKKEE